MSEATGKRAKAGQEDVVQIHMRDSAEVMRCIVVRQVVNGSNCQYMKTSVYTMDGELLATMSPTPASQMEWARPSAGRKDLGKNHEPDPT